MTTDTIPLAGSWAADPIPRGAHGVVPIFSCGAALGESQVPRPLLREGLTLWPTFILPLRKEESSHRITTVLSPFETRAFIPRTPLGRRLLSLRNQAIASGMKLLSVDEVLEEVKRRRGELDDNEANLY